MKALQRQHEERCLEEFKQEIERLSTIHTRCSESIYWERIKSKSPPRSPHKMNSLEKSAQEALDDYRPGFFDRFFKLEEKRKKKYLKAIEEAKQKDEEIYQQKIENYEKKHTEWKNKRDLADRILNKDPKAFEDVVKKNICNFEDIGNAKYYFQGFGEELSIYEVEARIDTNKAIPSFEIIRLDSGRIKQRDMPKKRSNELLQMYLCGSIIRIARELFALLPLKFVIVNCRENRLNTQTGHMEDVTILSVIFPRKEFNNLNFKRINPFDAMKNFEHRIDFKITKGFLPIQEFNRDYIDSYEENALIQSELESRKIPEEFLKEEKIEVKQEFDRKKLEELIDALIFAPMGKTAITLRESILEELDQSANKYLSEKTCRRLSKWCHTGGTYKPAMEIARKISINLFGRVLERDE